MSAAFFPNIELARQALFHLRIIPVNKSEKALEFDNRRSVIVLEKSPKIQYWLFTNRAYSGRYPIARRALNVPF